jgi:hypothetical protein
LKTYSFINPESNLSVSQFMLETSVADGILTPTQTGCYRSKTIAQTDEAIYWPRQNGLPSRNY